MQFAVEQKTFGRIRMCCCSTLYSLSVRLLCCPIPFILPYRNPWVKTHKFLNIKFDCMQQISRCTEVRPSNCSDSQRWRRLKLRYQQAESHDRARTHAHTHTHRIIHHDSNAPTSLISLLQGWAECTCFWGIRLGWNRRQTSVLSHGVSNKDTWRSW